MTLFLRFFTAILLVSSAFKGFAADKAGSTLTKAFAAWNEPFKPFHIIGNVYYVGATGVSSFLITTPEGHILLDTGFEDTVPLIQKSVAELGFKFGDIKFILSSHAHIDHTGGHGLARKLTGAEILMSEADAALIGSGGKNDFPPDLSALVYTPVKVDRIIKDGEIVSLGGVQMKAHLTPGHTKGCTTWTMTASDGGKNYNVVFFGSTSILDGVKLVNNPKYPGIADDLKLTYRTLKSLPCDVFLAPHGGFFGMADKHAKLMAGALSNPFIDPAGYKQYIVGAEANFLKQLAGERKAQ